MENNFTKNKHTTTILEIPIPSKPCSNLHLLKQLQIFIQHNNIPIQITTSSSSSQKGGSSNIEQETKPFIYQSEYTPYSIFKGFMDKYVLQKQHENTEDIKNKQLLDSMFSKDKSKKEMIHSLQTLSKIQSREEGEKESSTEEKEPEPESSREEEPSKKTKKIEISLTDTNTLYMHINTNHPTPIESIQGTKLYYLYQRQQNAQCAQFI